MREKEMEEHRSASVGRASVFSHTQIPQRRKKKISKLNYNNKYNIRRVKELPPKTTYHAIFVFLISSLIGVLQVNGPVKFVMGIHETSICVFVLSIIIYCVAFAIDHKKNSQPNLQQNSSNSRLSSIAIISGALSSFSLFSFFFSRSFQHLIFISWAFVSVTFVVYRHVSLIQEVSIKLHHKFLDIWNQFKGKSSLDKRPSLPV